MIRSLRRTRGLIALAIATVALAIPATASAGTYYWSGSPSNGANGFSFSSSGAAWNIYGGRCENVTGNYPKGAVCNLHWQVPANLVALDGRMTGLHREANSAFRADLTVYGNTTTSIGPVANPTGFDRQWPSSTGVLDFKISNVVGATNTSAGTVYLSSDNFTTGLTDPYTPSIQYIYGNTGWKGAGGACIQYGAHDDGSGIAAMALTGNTYAATFDNPGYNNGNITTGTFDADRNCIGIGAPGTGTYSYRAGVSDKSGNYGYADFNISFDVTAPTVSVPAFGGTALVNGQEFKGSLNQYKPTLTWTAGDANSGLASTSMVLDGATVSTNGTYTPASNLGVGNHTVTVYSTDNVGNTASVTRTFKIVDDVAPTFTVAQPGSTGGNTPALDVTAADDLSGVAPNTYTVSVNGVALVATTNTNRLQAALGRVVDGTHTFVVTVKDASGNTGTKNITYLADGDPAVPNLDTASCPDLSCIQAIQAPTATTDVNKNDVLTISAVVSKNGRPVSGAATIVKGATVLGTATISENGVAQFNVTINTPGPLAIKAPAGSGLTDLPVEYNYIPDTTPPTFTVASPGASGLNEPVLDVTAADTQTGIDASSWTVTVDGAPLVATSANARLQANIGYLVDGTHTIVVKVKDGDGNEATQTITYVADSGDDVPNPPADACPNNTCVFVFNQPTASTIIPSGTTIRIGALFMINGRPVTGRVEIRSGNVTLAGKDTGANGVVDMSVLIDRAGPLTLVAPEGSGIPDYTINYSFQQVSDPTSCSKNPNAVGCKSSGGGSANGGGADGAPGSANGGALPAGCTATSSATCPRGVVYYLTVNGQLTPFWNGVPLGESGSKFDKIAPKWTLKLVQQKKGKVRKSRKLTFKLWTSEAGFVGVTPTGGKKANLVSARQKERLVTVVVPPSSKLGKQLAKAKAGTMVKVSFAVVAFDLNKNSTKKKVVTFKIRA